MMISTGFEDLRHALRSLAKTPGFTLVVVLTLAIALGAATTMFAFVDAVLLEALPFEEPERLVALWDSNPQGGIEKSRVSPFNFRHWKERGETFESLALYQPASVTMSGLDEPIRLAGSLVSEEFFEVLKVEAALGRGLLAEDFETGAKPVIAISHALWSSRFGADPGAVGRQVNLNGQPYTIVGVMPRQILPRAALPSGRVDVASDAEHLWVPLAPLPEHQGHICGVLGRLAPGVTLEGARSELATLARALEEEFPESNADYTVRLVPLVEEVVGDVEQALWILFGAVGLILLIACVNVAHLLLVRTLARGRELAIRTALGSSKGALLRLFLAEGLVLVAVGTALGTFFSIWGMQILARLDGGRVPRLDEAALDGRALVAVLVLALLSVAVFAAVPVLRVRWRELESALHESQRSGGDSRGTARLRRWLVAVEVTLAVILVIGSALLIKSFGELSSADAGFAEEPVLVFRLQLPPSAYDQMPGLVGFYEELLGELEALPGAEAAVAAYDPPLAASWSQGFRIVGAPDPEKGEEPSGLFRTVTPGYFAALGIELVQGRDFTASDGAQSRGVVIVNQELAERHFPNRNPLGESLEIQTLQWRWGEEAIPSTFEIVGVARNVRSSGLDTPAEPAFYVPYRQAPHQAMHVLIRTGGDPRALLPAVRERVRQRDPGLPLIGIDTLAEMRAEQVSGPRFNTVVLGLFAGIALILAMVGLWGVVHQNTLQRRQEIGVRMAVGAESRDILGLMLFDGLKPVLLGVLAGVVGTLALNRLLSGLLYGISSSDPLTYAQVALGLVAIAALACFFPARRAAEIEPMRVLREE